MTPNDQVKFLVGIGIMPSIAEKAVSTAERRGHVPLTRAQMVKRAEIKTEDITLAQNWWYYTSAVPQEIRRILDAEGV